ncbi:MAG: ABC transporter ATP-binding protein [Pseudonocardiaceae bacterium]
MAALAVLGLVPPPGVVEGGSIRFDGAELVGAAPARLRELRGRRIGMVFQDPARALDPVRRVGYHLAEAVGGGRIGRVGGAALLARVGLPAELLRRYPHQLSGGQQRRVMIACAIAGDPELLIADEPTSALDAVSQVLVLRELMRIRAENGCALLLISHQLGLVSRVADRLAVMYLGQLMEQAGVAALGRDAAHPYTRALLAATPGGTPGEPVRPIPGPPGVLTDVPPGCPFHPRCALAQPQCRIERPALRRLGGASAAACHLAVPVGPCSS